MTDSNIRQIVIASSTQTFKSGISEVFTPYVVVNAPAPMLRIYQNDPAANQCFKTRIQPLLESNDKIRVIQGNDRFNTKEHTLNLPPTMFIKACGTSEDNLHSLSIKYAMLDEVHLYEDPELVGKVRARTTAFENSYLLGLFSQPDFEGSQLHKEYVKGDVKVFGWHCPNCNVLQDYEFNGEKDGKYFGVLWTPQNKANTYTYDERTDNTRLVCQHCFHEVSDNDENTRINLINNGKYILTSKGLKGYKSYSWSQFVNKDITFKKIAMQYIEAKEEHRQTKNTTKLRSFRNQVLGKFQPVGELVDAPKLLQDLTAKPSDTWPEETHRFMVIDVQLNCLYWLILAGSNKVSEARLIDWGVCVGYDEIVEIRKKYNVHPLCVGIDARANTMTVFKESIQRGEVYEQNGKKKYATWTCLMGDGGKFTPRMDWKHTDGTHRYYSPEAREECQWEASSKYKGIKARLILWSNRSVKALVEGARDKTIPFVLKFNNRADETFTKQMYSEQLDLKSNRYIEVIRNNNHLWDCMCMGFVMLLMSKCFIPAASNIKDLVETTSVVPANQDTQVV